MADKYFIASDKLPTNHWLYDKEQISDIDLDDIVIADTNSLTEYQNLPAKNIYDDTAHVFEKFNPPITIPDFKIQNNNVYLLKGYAPYISGSNIGDVLDYPTPIYSNTTQETYPYDQMYFIHIHRDSNQKLKIEGYARNASPTLDYTHALPTSAYIEAKCFESITTEQEANGYYPLQFEDSKLIDKNIYYLYLELCAGGGGSGSTSGTDGHDTCGAGAGGSLCAIIPTDDVYVAVGSGGKWGNKWVAGVYEDHPYNRQTGGNTSIKLYSTDGWKGYPSWISFGLNQSPSIICQGGQESISIISHSKGTDTFNGVGGNVYFRQADNTYSIIKEFNKFYNKAFVLYACSGGDGGHRGYAGNSTSSYLVNLLKDKIIDYGGRAGGNPANGADTETDEKKIYYAGGGGASLFGAGGSEIKNIDKNIIGDGRGPGGGASGRADTEGNDGRNGFCGGPGYFHIIY